jgi:aconitate hydratase
VIAGSDPALAEYPPVTFHLDGEDTTIRTGSVAIAAITSCTNTSNPTVMIGAGLLARNAVARGLTVGPTVKTSLAPGSKAVTGYLEAAGLMAPLEQLGFALAGYGCTTCIGNSGPLDEPIAAAIEANDLVVAAVLSGNRNFEGRIHPLARASYLASPPLVVAFALAGRVDVDLTTEPLGTGSDGRPVFLADLWPSADEVRDVIGTSIDPELFRRTYAVVFDGDERWRALPIPAGDQESRERSSKAADWMALAATTNQRARKVKVSPESTRTASTSATRSREERRSSTAFIPARRWKPG